MNFKQAGKEQRTSPIYTTTHPHPQKAQKIAVPLNIRVKARIKGGERLKIC